MKKIEDPLRDAVFDLIYSGARGQMTNGDSYGVWLVGETNNTTASVETWKQKHAVEMASRTALRVKDNGSKGRARLDLALADANGVARAVGDVTVILVSNGETPLRGTPFDKEINAATEAMLPGMRKALVTVNTVLVAREGRFVGWAVNSPDFLLIMPDLLPKPKRAPVEPVVAKAVPAPPVAPPAPKSTAKPLYITKESVEQEKKATRALASLEGSPTPVTPAVIAAVPPVVASAPATNPPATRSIHSPPVAVAVAAVAAVPPAAPGPAVNLAPVSAAPAEPVESPKPAAFKTSVPAPTPSAALPAAPPALAAVTAVATSPASVRPWLWITLSAGLAVTLVLVILLRRERGEEASLISRAAALERRHAARAAPAEVVAAHNAGDVSAKPQGR